MFQSYTEKVYRPDLKSIEPQFSQAQWYTCELCKDTTKNAWFSETDLQVHKKEAHFGIIKHRMITNADRFCTICMGLETNHDALIRHVKTRHLLSSPKARRVEREVFICNHCNHLFFNKEVLKVHIMCTHLWNAEQRRSKRVTCPKCQKTCNLKSLWHHLQYHEIPSLSVCDICLKHCLCVADLMLHIKEHSMFFKCEICSYQTLKEHLFELHLDHHKRNTFNKNAVSLLRRRLLKNVFLKDKSMKNHQKVAVQRFNIHNTFKGLYLPDFMHICIICREICSSRDEMAEHLLRDHTDSAKKQVRPTFRCFCGEHFYSKVMLKHHIFKLKGTHEEVTDDAAIPGTVSSNTSNIDQENSMELTAPEEYTETEVNPEFMEVVIPMESEQSEADEDNKEIDYIYAESEEPLVAIDTSSEQVIGL